MKTSSLKKLAKGIFVLVLISVSAPVYGDTLDRTNWFDSSGLMTASPGHLEMPLTNNGAQFFTTYFAPTNNPLTLSTPGNQIKLTWVFTPSGVSTFSTETPLAVGLVYTSNTNRLTADGTPNDDDYPGYAAFAGFGNGNFWNFQLANRADASTPSDLFVAGTSPGRDGWSVNAVDFPDDGGGPDDTPYTFTITLTRNSTGGIAAHSQVVVNSAVLDDVSFVDSMPASFNFNTVSIFNDGNIYSGLLDTTLFKVEFFTNSAPSIDTVNSQSCYPGNTVPFAANVSGSLPLSYQWSYNGTNISGATNVTLALTNVQFNQSGIYGLTVTNAYGSDVNTNATLTVNPLPYVAPPPPGIISWRPADGNANDIVGGNNGTIVSNVVYENAQTAGQSFLINGNNSGVSVGSAVNLHLQDFTIEAWIQRTDNSLASPGGGPGWLFSYGNGGYGFGVNDDGTLVLSKIGSDSLDSTINIPDTNWHHVAVTKSGTDVRFYVDGNFFGDSTYASVFSFSTAATIGAQTASPLLNSFYGAIDELTIYNHALTPQEILSIYDGGGKSPQLPQLQISFDGTNAIVVWPEWAGDFQLQTATDSPGVHGSWNGVDGSPQSDGLNFELEVPVTADTQFFRLVYYLPGGD